MMSLALRRWVTAGIIPLLITTVFIPESEGVIQVVIDLDNDSEDLLGNLIEKVDSLIDPKIIDAANATNELAYALLRVSPLLTLYGNISDTSRGISMSFTLNAKAHVGGDKESDDDDEDQPHLYYPKGLLGQIVAFVEPYFLATLTFVLQVVLSMVLGNVLAEAGLYASA